ncbi:c-type cytochrome [Roseovarius amoyensis]|uniref:c-type cytochrome n=1 Tax=Roseovarius amoyensis TaxID=2211448 RepID=UPI000DBE683A|nr:cytochrome c [Roseovarius amoyensis]
MRRQRAAFASVIGAAVVGAISVAGYLLIPDRPTPQLLNWTDVETVARGKKLYQRECSACHGALEGGASAASRTAAEQVAPPHDVNGHTWQHPDFALFQLTKSGEAAALCRALNQAGMPQFADSLSDHQIVDVLSYIKSTWPTHIRAKQDAANTLYSGQNTAYRALLYPSEF